MTAAWPGDSATVVAWVRDALTRMSTDGEVAIRGLDDIKVSADLNGTDLRQLTVDATGVKLRIDASDTSPPASTRSESEPADPAEPVLRETGIAENLRFFARPMRIQRTPVTFDLRLHDLPISWLTFAEPTDPDAPTSIHAIVPDDNAPTVRGTLHAAIRTTDIAPLVSSVMRPLLREGGVHLGRVRVDVTSETGDGIRFMAFVGMRWKLFAASARANGMIRVTRDAVITVEELTVGSRNPLVKVALMFARKHVRELIGQSVDLNAQLAEDGTTTRIHDLSVTTGDQLTVSARFS